VPLAATDGTCELLAMSRWHTVLRTASAALVIAGCSETGAPDGIAGRTRVLLAVASSHSGEVLEITSWYLRADQTVVPLGTTDVPLQDGATQTLSIDIDIAGCIADAAREGTGTGCPVRLLIELRDATGDVLDEASVGPLDAEPGEVLSPPAVTLRHVERIVLSTATATFFPGTTANVTAEVFDRSNAMLTDRILTWSSSNTSAASVDQQGTVTALSPGQTTIRAALAGRTTGPEGTILLTVGSLTSVSVAPPSSTIGVGAQVQLAATVQPPSAPQSVTWSTGDQTIATVDNTGNVTGIGRGTTTITATSTVDPSRMGASTITVLGVIGIAVAPTVDSVRVNGTTQFLATVNADGGVSTAATWSSLDPPVATVNPATGLATGVSPGMATIRATAAADVTKVADATLHVLSPCDLPLIATIGQTVNAVIDASSCGNGQFNLEHIAYPGNDGSPAIMMTGSATIGFDFSPLVVPRGYWFFASFLPGTISTQVWAGTGTYRSFVQNRLDGDFGNVSWTTAPIAPVCGYAMSATNVTVGPFAFTTSCPRGPPGPALVPTGTYYGIWIDLLPPLMVGEGYTIQATTDGFPPRIVLWNNADPATQYQAIATGTSTSLSYTATMQTNAGYHRALVTSATPGLTGNITISIAGPPASVALMISGVAGAKSGGGLYQDGRAAGPGRPPDFR